MKYIRTKDKILIAPDLYDNGGIVLCSDPPKYETRNAKNEWGCVDVSEVIKQADTIEDLIQEGDLVRYVDTTKPYPYQGMFTEIGIFNPYGTAIYRVVELYIKQPNGDYKLVAREKGNYKLELV